MLVKRLLLCVSFSFLFICENPTLVPFYGAPTPLFWLERFQL